MHRASLGSLMLLATLVLAAPAWAQQGALVVPRNLQQLTERAAIIVRGNVVSARMERHPQLGLPMLVVQLHVRETLKGPQQQMFTFRQYIWDYRERLRPASYRKGDDVLLLMIAPSRYGLSSPAGLEQGRFRIERDLQGRELAANGLGNARLFDGLEAQAAKSGIALSASSSRIVRQPPQGPVEAGALLALVRELVNGRR